MLTRTNHCSRTLPGGSRRSRYIDSIEDSLFSIGHTHDRATNQHDAQKLLQNNDYGYVLLDLQIPAKPHRGGADHDLRASQWSQATITGIPRRASGRTRAA
jgi:DNA-binding response OmpR family regulator